MKIAVIKFTYPFESKATVFSRATNKLPKKGTDEKNEEETVRGKILYLKR